MDTGEIQGETFMIDAKPNREPVKLFQHWSDVHDDVFLALCGDPGSDVVNMLWTLQLTPRKAPEMGVTTVQA